MNTTGQKTRLRITLIATVLLAILAFASIIAKMENAALAAISGIGLLGGGYQASQGFTKGQYIKSNPKSENLEG